MIVVDVFVVKIYVHHVLEEIKSNRNSFRVVVCGGSAHFRHGSESTDVRIHIGWIREYRCADPQSLDPRVQICGSGSYSSLKRE